MGLWRYFFVTLLIELPIVVLFFKSDWKFALLVAFLLNLFTWPLLHVLFFYTGIHVYILEVAVLITEATGYKLLMQCSWKKALLLSLLANGTSYGIGLILNHYI